VALTLSTRDRSGDERRHARAVASHLGVELIEAARDTRLVDLATSEARNLPRPSARGFAQATTRIASKTASFYGATAVFDGGGGDNMFASLQSTAPVADCLSANGGAGRFWRTARSIGIAAQTSIFTVARRAVVRTWTRGPAFRWPVDLALLSPQARGMAASAADHPWLNPPAGTLPGSAAHMALIAAAQSVVQGRDGARPLPDLSPLIAQPVAESCLRVPSWLWTCDGQNRVIARDGCRTMLPPAIVDRRDKGAPDSFLVELIDANCELVRAMLTEGLLAEQNILDRTALAAALEPAALAKGFGYIRVMQLVDAEAWVRSWSGDRAGR
ncbi:MAG: asparagine synthetase B family protein, partial [Sphingomonadaceae bacterium]|nr:asparagine synthetase B family protein [Sphingomonadaceae bacterium]